MTKTRTTLPSAAPLSRKRVLLIVVNISIDKLCSYQHVDNLPTRTYLSQAPISALVDLTWGGWRVARETAAENGIPYAHVEISNRYARQGQFTTFTSVIVNPGRQLCSSRLLQGICGEYRRVSLQKGRHRRGASLRDRVRARSGVLLFECLTQHRGRFIYLFIMNL